MTSSLLEEYEAQTDKSNIWERGRDDIPHADGCIIEVDSLRPDAEDKNIVINHMLNIYHEQKIFAMQNRIIAHADYADYSDSSGPGY